MQEQFIPYTYALQLQELGMPNLNLNLLLGCFAYYGAEKSSYKGQLIPNNTFTKHSKFDYSEFVFAPLWQQAFDWFDENGLSGEVYSSAPGYRWCICKSSHNPESNISGGTSICDSGYDGPNEAGCYNTKEQARTACLMKLIEMYGN